MSRPILSLNLTEDRIIERLDAARARQRAPKPKPKRLRETAAVIWLDGVRYVPTTNRDAAESLFPGLKGRGE